MSRELEEHIDALVADWPPITEETLDRIAALLRVGARAVDAA